MTQLHADVVERQQKVENLALRLREYYCHSRDETLKNLAATVEDLAFRHARTQAEYIRNFTSMSAQEVKKASQVFDIVNGAGRSNRQGGTRKRGIWEILTQGDRNSSKEKPSGNDDKARKQAARRKIIARRRKWARQNDTSQYLFPAEFQQLSAKEKGSHRVEGTSKVFANSIEAEHGEKKSHQSAGLSAFDGVEDWIEDFLDCPT